MFPLHNTAIFIMSSIVVLVVLNNISVVMVANFSDSMCLNGAIGERYCHDAFLGSAWYCLSWFDISVLCFENIILPPVERCQVQALSSVIYGQIVVSF